jgi:hypothetical protein
MPRKIKSIRINRLSATEYDIIRENPSDVDAHVRWETDCWVMSIFEGQNHRDSFNVGATQKLPDWNLVVNEILNWKFGL